MKFSDVTMVRIYLTETEKLLKKLLAKLHDEEKVRGVTVFRGISGFGRSGVVHSSTLLDPSLDLPVVIEFFDEPAKVKRILAHLKDMLPPGHVVSYEDVARMLGTPTATRAVASAVAQNPVGFLIPCHRVIRKTGAFGEYRWGTVRKQALLVWEGARCAAPDAA